MNATSLFFEPSAIIFLKIFLAMLLGGLMGTERSVIAHQPAGTRTFGLVALGSCLFVVIANYVQGSYVGVISFDPLRIAAAVITGIGFIGGGLIVMRGDVLHGSTTAAGLWVACGVGVAIAYGMYLTAVFTTLLTLVMFTAFWYIEDRFKHWFDSVHNGSS